MRRYATGSAGKIINLPPELPYLIIESALFLSVRQEIELYLSSINMAIDIHDPVFKTIPVHDCYDMKYSNHHLLSCNTKLFPKS